MVESVDAYAARHGLVGRSDERALLRTNNCPCDPAIYRARRYQRGHPSLSIPATELGGRSAKCLRSLKQTPPSLRRAQLTLRSSLPQPVFQFVFRNASAISNKHCAKNDAH